MRARTIGRLLLALTAACADGEAPPQDGGAPVADEASATEPAPIAEPEPSSSPRDPCTRTVIVRLDSGVSVELPSPCRPYDPVRDLPDPPP